MLNKVNERNKCNYTLIFLILIKSIIVTGVVTIIFLSLESSLFEDLKIALLYLV